MILSVICSKYLIFLRNYRVKIGLVNTQSLITSMMPLSLVLEVLVSERLSAFLKQDSRLLVFQSFSQQGHTQLQLRVVLMLLWVICIMMIGDGIFMIQSKVVTGWVTRMPFST